jgi:hypothetical protein
MRGMQCKVEFGYQLSICSKDRGKPRKTLTELGVAKVQLNVILEFSPYLKENTTLHHYKDQLVNAV